MLKRKEESFASHGVQQRQITFFFASYELMKLISNVVGLTFTPSQSNNNFIYYDCITEMIGNFDFISYKKNITFLLHSFFCFAVSGNVDTDIK